MPNSVSNSSQKNQHIKNPHQNSHDVGNKINNNIFCMSVSDIAITKITQEVLRTRQVCAMHFFVAVECKKMTKRSLKSQRNMRPRCPIRNKRLVCWTMLTHADRQADDLPVQNMQISEIARSGRVTTYTNSSEKNKSNTATKKGTAVQKGT